MTEAETVVKIIHDVRVAGLGGFDGCYCCSFQIRGVGVDVSCRKGSNMDSIFPDFYGIGIRVHSHRLDATKDVLEAVAREVVSQFDDTGSAIMVRYCEWQKDKDRACSYCGKPRAQSAYLCETCQAGNDGWGSPLAPQYAFEFDGVVKQEEA